MSQIAPLVDRNRFPPFVLEGAGTLQEHISSWIRDAVFSGCFLPGERLTQAELASLLDVSMTPVRESMRELAAEGLLTLNPRRGITVSRLSCEEAQEMRMLGGLLESKSGQLIAERILPGELAKAREMAAGIAGLQDLRLYFLGNQRFHTFLYKTARSPELTKMLMRVHDRTLPYLPAVFDRLGSRHRDGLHEHDSFLEACAQRDARAASDIMFRHWDMMFAALEAIVAETAGPAEQPD